MVVPCCHEALYQEWTNLSAMLAHGLCYVPEDVNTQYR